MPVQDEDERWCEEWRGDTRSGAIDESRGSVMRWKETSGDTHATALSVGRGHAIASCKQLGHVIPVN